MSLFKVGKVGVSLRNVLTPERIPSLVIPRSPMCLLSPRRESPFHSNKGQKQRRRCCCWWRSEESAAVAVPPPDVAPMRLEPVNALGSLFKVGKVGVSLRNVLTPERIPSLVIPRSPMCLLSPSGRRDQPDRFRLLSQDSTESRSEKHQQHLAPPPLALTHHPVVRPSPARGFRLGRHRNRDNDGPSTTKTARDTDLSTRAAMSLEHVEKATTLRSVPPGRFRAVLAASPCVRRRESPFHSNKGQKQRRRCCCWWRSEESAAVAVPPPDVAPMRLEPVNALGRKVMRAAHRALSPNRRRLTEQTTDF